MPKIFISHSSKNNAEALALRDWLVARGWDDLFLDIDPQRGLVAGQQWIERLQQNAQRCKAVLFVLSREWLASRYCLAEFWEARKEKRALFAVVIDDTAVKQVPPELTGWQLTFLTQGSAFETFRVLPPPGYAAVEVSFAREGLESLRLGLAAAGLTSFDTLSFPWPAPGFEYEADGKTPRRPYRGLQPIDGPDAGVFFGREADLVRSRDLLAQLREAGGRKLVVILGASGAGKSSFLRAGLLPRLGRDDRNFFQLPIVRPREAPMWGQEGLLAALELAFHQADLAVTRADLRASLEAGGEDFVRRTADLRAAVVRGLPEGAKAPTLVLPLDQAEELFTVLRGQEGREESVVFLQRLSELLHHGPEALVVATIRSDAYAPLQVAEALAGIPQIPFNLPPLEDANYKSVIEGPAHRLIGAGRPLQIEPALVAALLADAKGSDALPLLGFTLERIFTEYGGAGDLALHHYTALGGVRGSIEAAVAEAFANAEASPSIPSEAAEREALLKKAFVPHLMGINEANGQPVRRTARRSDLPKESAGLIERLVDRRMLVVDQELGNASVLGARVEVAHEALLRHWPTLLRWHDEEGGALRVQQEVVRSAVAWETNLQAPDWLSHRGTRLAEAEFVAQRDDFLKVFEGKPRRYLDACLKAEESAQEEERRRLDRQRRLQARQRVLQRRASYTLVAVALLVALFAGYTLRQSREVARQVSRVLVDDAQRAIKAGEYARAARFAILAARESWLEQADSQAPPSLASAALRLPQVLEIPAHQGRVEGWEESSHGKLWLSWGTDDKVRVWDAGTGALKAEQSYQRSERGASFDSEGQRVLSVSLVGFVSVWNAASGSLISGWQDAGVDGAIFSPTGAVVLSWCYRSGLAQVHDATSGQQLVQFSPGKLSGASFDRNGSRILTWAGSGVTMWDAASGQLLASSPVQDLAVGSTFSPDGTRIYSWSPGKFWAWDATYGRLLFELPYREGTHTLTSKEGDRAISIDEVGEAELWNTVSGQRIGQFGGRPLDGASFSADGKELLLWSSSGHWSIYDAKTGVSVVDLGKVADGVKKAALANDRRKLLFLFEDGWLRVVSRDQSELGSLKLNNNISAEFAKDSGSVITWDLDGNLKLLKVKELMQGGTVDQEAIQSAAANNSPTIAPTRINHALSKAGDLDLIWGAQSSYFTLHRIVDGKQQLWLRESNDIIGGAEFSPDGARVLSWDRGGTAEVWETMSGVRIGSVQHRDAVLGATFSPDGRQVVSWDQNSLFFWDAETGLELAEPRPGIWYASFDATGGRVNLTNFTGARHLWDVGWAIPRSSNAQLIAEVCNKELAGPEQSWPATGAARRSVRRISKADAERAPILRDRVGEDVCRPLSWLERLLRVER